MTENDVRALLELKMLARDQLNVTIDLPRMLNDAGYCSQCLASLEARASAELMQRIQLVRSMLPGPPAGAKAAPTQDKYRGTLR